MDRKERLYKKLFIPRNGKSIGYGINVCIILIPLFSLAQNNYKTQTKKNNIYIEILGAAPMCNISYGRQIVLSPRDKFSFDIGFQFAPFVSSKWTTGISPQCSYMYGRTNYFEIGVGSYYDFYWSDFVPFPKIGYRYQKKEGGFFAKTELTPLFLYFNPKVFILPWAGAGFGLAF